MKKKDPNKKRSYWGFFAKTFTAMLAAVFAVEALICYTVYHYELGNEESGSYDRLTKLTDWLSDPENADATEAEIRTQLSFKTANDVSWVDRAVVLYDMKTGKTYDSRQMLWSLVKIHSDSTEYLEALQDAYHGRADLSDRNEIGAFVHIYISDDISVFDPYMEYREKDPMYGCMITVNDVYVKDDHVIPGSGSIGICYAEEDSPRFSFPIEPPAQIPEGYVHFVKKYAETHPADALIADSIFFLPVGSMPDSPALAEAHAMLDAYQNTETTYESPALVTPGKQSLTKAEISRYSLTWMDAGEDRWKICGVTYYNFLLAHRWHIVVLTVIPLILLILFALLIAKIRYMRYCREYELNEYRRNLTAALAHDLKSPLMAISGYAENLRDNIHTEKRAAYADSILQNTQYMDRLIADVLDLAKLEQSSTLQKQPCDTAMLAKESAAQFAAQMEEAHLTFSVSGNGTVSADPRMMAQLLTNLIGNAVKYTPEGGRIEVSVTDRELRIRNDTDGTVRDADKLIHPFVKGSDTRGSRTGSGMGLAIVRQICELHGFRLDVSSEEKQFLTVIRF
jgi:signal transduction histidine kinase